MQTTLTRMSTFFLLSYIITTGSLLAVSHVREFKGTKVAFFTLTPDILNTTTVTSKKALDCLLECTAHVAPRSCRLVEIEQTTGECRLMGSDQASNEARGDRWRVYKVHEKHQDWEIVINNAAVDWYGAIPTTPVQLGSNITVVGIPFANNPGRISIELAHGPELNYDQALHMNGRFDYLGDIDTVTLNSKINRKFGTKVKVMDKFPFRRGVQFELTLQMEENDIRIIIDGETFTRYRHRLLPLSDVSHLFVRGDMQLVQLRFQ